LALGLGLIVVGAAMLSMAPSGNGWVFAVWGAVLVLGLLVERVRYKRILRHPPGTGWEPTAERFLDERSGQMVRVFTRRETGERVYVRD
jgi:hypothetical protein